MHKKFFIGGTFNDKRRIIKISTRWSFLVTHIAYTVNNMFGRN